MQACIEHELSQKRKTKGTFLGGQVDKPSRMFKSITMRGIGQSVLYSVPSAAAEHLEVGKTQEQHWKDLQNDLPCMFKSHNFNVCQLLIHPRNTCTHAVTIISPNSIFTLLT